MLLKSFRYAALLKAQLSLYKIIKNISKKGTTFPRNIYFTLILQFDQSTLLSENFANQAFRETVLISREFNFANQGKLCISPEFNFANGQN